MRLDDFTNFEDAQFNDVDTVLETGGRTADIYRPSMTGNPGFDTEVGSETRVARILIHLAKKSSGATKAGTGGGSSASKMKFIGLIASSLVRRGDVLVIAGSRYKVVEIDVGSEGKSEIELERTEWNYKA